MSDDRLPVRAKLGDGPTLVVSDVHIGAISDTTEDAFLDFLDFASAVAGTLVVNGDLFDVGPLDTRWCAPGHARLLERLRRTIASGVSIIFVGGNRDPIEWCGATLARLGVRVYSDPTRLVLSNRTTLIAHGDGGRHGAARPYTKPYPWLRHPLLIETIRRVGLVPRLHGLLSSRSPTRDRVTAASRGASTGPKRRAAAIEAWARAAFVADPELNLVVAGHSHAPALVEVEPGRYYVNAGDWISHLTYVVVPQDGGAPEVRYWPSREIVDWGTLHDVDVPTEKTNAGRS